MNNKMTNKMKLSSTISNEIKGNLKDSCFLTNYVLVKKYLGGGKFSCFYYRKKDSHSYLDIFLKKKKTTSSYEIEKTFCLI